MSESQGSIYSWRYFSCCSASVGGKPYVRAPTAVSSSSSWHFPFLVRRGTGSGTCQKGAEESVSISAPGTRLARSQGQATPHDGKLGTRVLERFAPRQPQACGHATPHPLHQQQGWRPDLPSRERPTRPCTHACATHSKPSPILCAEPSRAQAEPQAEPYFSRGRTFPRRPRNSTPTSSCG